MTKHVLLASVFAIGLLPVPASAAEWTGLYVGLNAGGVFGDVDLVGVSEATSYVEVFPGDRYQFEADGVLGGAQLGYNFVFGNWLVGVEAAGHSLSSDDRVLVPGEPNILDLETEWLASASARFGFVLSSSSLIYLKGGYAAASISTHYLDNVGGGATVGTYDTDEIHSGFVLGAGVEHMISSDVSFGFEYNYVDLEEQTHSAIATGAGGGLVETNVEAELHTVTARLNWNFWSP
ncbi:MAG: porin family protein [Alphaproteobacteria bacterium]|nr:porin family protein [Alphaproteobacteria bacterium]